VVQRETAIEREVIRLERQAGMGGLPDSPEDRDDPAGEGLPRTGDHQ